MDEIESGRLHRRGVGVLTDDSKTTTKKTL
jgi:hypothetical protein